SVIASREIRAQYEAEGFPCFEDPSRAVAAMAALMFYGEAFAAAPPGSPASLPESVLPEGPLGEREAKAVMKAAGLPVVEDVLATDPNAAATAASRTGGPVAMKIQSPDILHKTEAGGVALNVTAEAAPATFERIMAAARAHAPGARLEGVMVSPMVPDGVDCILGAKNDPVFGPVVLFGLGGIFTEVLGDVAFRRAPFDAATAREMIGEVKGRALLEGARGAEPADIVALSNTIARFSALAAALGDQVESLEINPLRALPDRCIALDALIVRKETP
ncbi:MAG: acetate--CoA ligase family protein, partial [Pseudomonadota bacterium]